MSFIPLSQQVEVYTPGPPVTARFGNERPGPGGWRAFRVASWWVHKTEEKDGEFILRTGDLLTVHVPPEAAPEPGGQVRLPDGSVWTVEGNPEDYTHGFHGWSPGLLVVHCKRVEG